jgi:hypothetical protein
MVLLGLNSMDFNTSKKKNLKSIEKALTIPEKISDESNLYRVPKDYTFPDGLASALINAKEMHVNVTVNGIKTRGASFNVSFYNEKFTVVTIRSKEPSLLGICDSEGKCIIVNQYYIDLSYEIAKNLLIASSLQVEICSKEDYCEAILFHEMLHYFNPNIEPTRAEFLAEYPPLESKAKNLYLTMRFFEHITKYEKTGSNNYGLVRSAYNHAFEIDHQVNDPSVIQKFKLLISKYGFEGLIQSYKDFK